MRVGIIGARRADQGLGPFVAGHLTALGAKVAAIVGTREETVAAAAAELRDRFGLEVREYCSTRDMFQRESLDAVAICSPQQFHAEHLTEALKHRVHALCEKPFVFAPGAENLAAARPLVEGFAAAGLVLMVNQQWPYTLPTFDRCWPEARHRGDARVPLTQLDMLLAPAADGPDMIPNAMPHALSMLLACAPAGGQIDALRIVRPGIGRLDMAFEYVHALGRVAVQTWLIETPRQPRPAGYAINGCTVRRTIRAADYAMFFETGGPALSEMVRSGPESATRAAPEAVSAIHADHTPLEDPLRLLLADFISRSRAGRSATGVDPAVLDNVRLLDELYAAAK